MLTSKIILYLASIFISVGAVIYYAWPLDYFEAESTEFLALSEDLDSPEKLGAAYFAFGSFSGLTSDTLKVSASPWKVINAALALEETDGLVEKVDTVDTNTIYQRFGFHFPTSFGNWPTDLKQPEIIYPVGQNVGFGRRNFPPLGVTIGNIGCAACHSSVMYNSDGSPNLNKVWLGTPNGSINLEAYTNAIFTALLKWTDSSEKLLATIERLYPETSWQEYFTIEYFILPEVRNVLAERNDKFGTLLPFQSSMAGATNGLDSLKNRLGLIPDNELVEHSAFNSVPDLGGRLWRSKLLNTGSYVIPNLEHNRAITKDDITPEHRENLASIIAYFTVPSMGVSPQVAEKSIDKTVAVTDWMLAYKPQPFPGSVNQNIARRGKQIYDADCASCHGQYNNSFTHPELVSFPNWEGDIGTDDKRIALLTDDVVKTINNSSYGKYVEARQVTTYTAPPLTGIWSSAPYFHNGSVPTLWHLLNPEQRPSKFYVGGHKLDLELIGIAGEISPDGTWNVPLNYNPWTAPVLVDTAEYGLSNLGHEKEFILLRQAEKQALLEYLKLL